MEFRSVVYNAARDGKLRRLRIFLDHKSREEVKSLVHAKTHGATPLIAACRHGHYDIVTYLVKTCKANIEQVGSVTFDGETIEGAPPLWCAAAAGHQEIVKFLIANGGRVNKTTSTNSTPLRAACFDGHIDIVKYLLDQKADIEIANRHGHTCLMISCYKGHYSIVRHLLDMKANVNRKSVKGNTALHDCAESGSLEILKLLLQHSASMDKDSYGMTPLLAASVTGHQKIVEYLIQQPNCPKPERIDALELLGATYVDKKRDMLGALQYWRRAMEDRYDVRPYVPKPRRAAVLNAAYEDAVEVNNLDDLEELISDPDDMRMQALLMRERILGPAHPDTSYYIRYRGAVYADMGNFQRCITLWTYALDMQQQMLDPVSPMTQSSLISFAELFSFMMSESRSRKPQVIEFRHIMSVTEKTVNELRRGRAHWSALTDADKSKLLPCERDGSSLNRTLVILMHLYSLMCKMTDSLTPDQEHLFKQSVYDMVRLDMRGERGMSLLHLACTKDTTTVGRYPVCLFPSADVATLLIEVGADVNASTNDLDTPLHVAARNPQKAEMMRLLLQHGAHVDYRNSQEKRPAELIPSKDGREALQHVTTLLSADTLQCLAARKIRESSLDYCDIIPDKWVTFIERH